MANVFDDDTVSEFELIAEDAEAAEQLAADYADQPMVVEADNEALDEIAEESTFELSHNESNVIYNARLRLEQAKLYELLINHNLFEGVEASQEAIKNVQNELKFYIVKRLEILLGLREPTVKAASVIVDAQFNDVEVDFLKQLAYKGTFGTSRQVEPAKAAVKSVINPVSKPIQKLKTFAAPKLGVPPPATLPAAKQRIVEAAKKVVPKLTVPPPKPAPQRKPVEKPQVGQSGMGRNLTEAEATVIAKADLKTSNGKPFHLMNAKEKASKIKEVNDRNKRPQSVGAMPMPSPDQLKMKYLMQQESSGHSKNQTSQFNNILASALAAKKNNMMGEDDGE